MADSADVLLARTRNALARWATAAPGTSAEWISATDLVDAVTDLDALLSAGGPLPAAWAACVPLPEHVRGDVPEFTKPESERTALDELQWYRGYTQAVRSEGAKQMGISVVANVLDAAFRSLAERDATIARLTAELDVRPERGDEDDG